MKRRVPRVALVSEIDVRAGVYQHTHGTRVCHRRGDVQRRVAGDARRTVHESFATRFFKNRVGASKRGVDAREPVQSGPAGGPTFTKFRVGFIGADVTVRRRSIVASGSVVVVVVVVVVVRVAATQLENPEPSEPLFFQRVLHFDASGVERDAGARRGDDVRQTAP